MIGFPPTQQKYVSSTLVSHGQALIVRVFLPLTTSSKKTTSWLGSQYGWEAAIAAPHCTTHHLNHPVGQEWIFHRITYLPTFPRSISKLNYPIQLVRNDIFQESGDDSAVFPLRSACGQKLVVRCHLTIQHGWLSCGFRRVFCWGFIWLEMGGSQN